MVPLRCALHELMSAGLAPSCTHCSYSWILLVYRTLWLLKLTSIDFLPIVPIWQQHGPVPPLPGSRGIAMNFAFRSREHTWALWGETCRPFNVSLRLYLQHMDPCREYSIFWGSRAFSCHLCRGTLCLASWCGCLLKYFMLCKELAHRSHHLRAAATPTNHGLLSHSTLSWFLSFCFWKPSASSGFSHGFAMLRAKLKRSSEATRAALLRGPSLWILPTDAQVLLRQEDFQEPEHEQQHPTREHIGRIMSVKMLKPVKSWRIYLQFTQTTTHEIAGKENLRVQTQNHKWCGWFPSWTACLILEIGKEG